MSPDPVSSHAAFRDKFQLNFPLLADTEHKVAELYGAWRERERNGKRFMGIQRSTFLIGPDGKVAKVWDAVQVDGHETEVLGAAKTLSESTDP